MTGGGDTTRQVIHSARTVAALDLYLRMRKKHKRAAPPVFWLGNAGALWSEGIAEVVARRSRMSGVTSRRRTPAPASPEALHGRPLAAERRARRDLVNTGGLGSRVIGDAWMRQGQQDRTLPCSDGEYSGTNGTSVATFSEATAISVGGKVKAEGHAVVPGFRPWAIVLDQLDVTRRGAGPGSSPHTRCPAV